MCSKTLVDNYKIAFLTALYSLYSLRYSLCTFSCTATAAICVLPAIMGTGPGFTRGMKVDPVRVWYVFGSRIIARYPWWPLPRIVSTDAVFSAANLCISFIFSYVSSPSYLGNIELGKLSMYCSIVRSTILYIFC